MKTNKIEFTINLLRRQQQFVMDRITPELLLSGERGAGKTYALANKLLDLAQTNKGGVGIAVVPTLNMGNKTLVATMKDVLQESHVDVHSTYTANPNVFTVYFGKQPSKIYVMSADQVCNEVLLKKKLKEWTEAEKIHFFGFEEPDLMGAYAETAWTNLINHLIDEPTSQAVAAGNAVEGFSFMRKHWTDEINRSNSGSRAIIRTVTEDNPYVAGLFKNTNKEQA